MEALSKWQSPDPNPSLPKSRTSVRSPGTPCLPVLHPTIPGPCCLLEIQVCLDPGRMLLERPQPPETLHDGKGEEPQGCRKGCLAPPSTSSLSQVIHWQSPTPQPLSLEPPGGTFTGVGWSVPVLPQHCSLLSPQLSASQRPLKLLSQWPWPPPASHS